MLESRPFAPARICMSVEQARFNMIEQQIRTWEVLDQDVLDLLYAVRRDLLRGREVETRLRFVGIGDGRGTDLEIAFRPIRKYERVLEVGTGSGYLAALLAARANHVHSVEISPKLKAFAEENLRRAGVENATVELGDSAQGWAAHAPYDVIVLTGSTPVLPPSFLAQLKTGGRLFAVVGDPPVMEARLVTCVGPGSHHTIDLFETSLAPLKNAMQPGRFQF